MTEAVWRTRVATATRAGPRPANQDRAMAKIVGPAGRALVAVADGMGGQQGGELASATVIESLSAAQPTVASQETIEDEWVLDLVRSINRRVHDVARRRGLDGMGTTLALLIGDGDTARIANVGDSRCYVLTREGVRQVTEDHSVTADAVRRGALAPEDAASHPYTHALTRAIGTDPDVQVDLFKVPLPPPGSEGVTFLLCSDGVWNVLAPQELAAILEASPGPTAAAEALVAEAVRRGTADNATAAVLEVGSGRAATIAPSVDGGLSDQETMVYRPRGRRFSRRLALLLILLLLTCFWFIIARSDSELIRQSAEWVASVRSESPVAPGSSMEMRVSEPAAEDRGVSEAISAMPSQRPRTVMLTGVDSAEVLVDGTPVGWTAEEASLAVTAPDGAVLEVRRSGEAAPLLRTTIGPSTGDTVRVRVERRDGP